MNRQEFSNDFELRIINLSKEYDYGISYIQAIDIYSNDNIIKPESAIIHVDPNIIKDDIKKITDYIEGYSTSEFLVIFYIHFFKSYNNKNLLEKKELKGIFKLLGGSIAFFDENYDVTYLK